MSSNRTRSAAALVSALLLTGGAASGAGQQRRAPDDTPAQEPMFFSALTGNNVEDLDLPEEYINSDDMIMVYQHHFGVYPAIVVGSGEIVNGGVPQEVNLAEHLRELTRDINRQIPEGYDGYVMIDYEEWHPFWEDTAGRYKVLSREIIRERHPNWNDALVERKARIAFEDAARKYIKRTLDKCHAMRPDAKWGIWSYPKAKFRDNNADWLWNRHDAFFPAVYMLYGHVPDGVEPGLGEESTSTFVEERLVGRIEYARELAGDRPVVSVVWPRYSRYNPNEWMRLKPLTQYDLTLAMGGSLDHGADGVAIWDHIPQPGVAQVFQDQFDSMIGPEIARLLAEQGVDVDNSQSGSDDDDAVASAENDSDSAEDDTPSSDDRLSATHRGSQNGVRKFTRRSRGGG